MARTDNDSTPPHRPDDEGGGVARAHRFEEGEWEERSNGTMVRRIVVTPEDSHQEMRRAHGRGQGHHRGHDSSLVRFASQYGWRAYAIPVLLVITVWLLWDVVLSSSDTQPAAESAASSAHDAEAQPGPNPAEHTAAPVGIKDLPPGGAFTEKGDGTYRVVGTPGAAAGEGTERVVRYVVEVENGVDTASYGGDDALARMIDATLTNPKGWIADPRFRFEHVAPGDKPTMRIQLTSTVTTHATCGNDLEMETSCFYQDGQRLVINESRWVRGASPFDGDIGSYRQYLLNHEMGHGLGYAAHEPCGGTGELAPVMMQQTLSLDNSVLYSIDSSEVYPDDGAHCQYNPWPYPKGAQR